MMLVVVTLVLGHLWHFKMLLAGELFFIGTDGLGLLINTDFNGQLGFKDSLTELKSAQFLSLTTLASFS